jgi:hypothetical protein
MSGQSAPRVLVADAFRDFVSLNLRKRGYAVREALALWELETVAENVVRCGRVFSS